MLIVVRHGRTAHNATGRLLGRLDPPLDPTGEAQADALASSLGPVARIVASPLARTRQTAEAIARASASVGGAADVELDDRFVELDYGELDGTPLVDVAPEVWASWRSDPSFRPPGGETLLELGERVRAGCQALAADAEAHDVVVVTHVSPVKAATCWALGVPDEVAWRLYVAPASITRLTVRAGRATVHGFNDTSHVPGALP